MLVANRNLGVCDLNAPTMVIWVKPEVGYSIGRIVFAEEQLARIIGQRNALLSNLEVNLRRRWQWPAFKQQLYSLANSLRPGQRFRVNAEQIKYVTCCSLRNELQLRR